MVTLNHSTDDKVSRRHLVGLEPTHRRLPDPHAHHLIHYATAYKDFLCCIHSITPEQEKTSDKNTPTNLPTPSKVSSEYTISGPQLTCSNLHNGTEQVGGAAQLP
ncbi:hypothetical protein E2C01_065583 [Portunus trituberculatus]|uniref:Uncharacterized protein n=1 Tax=Portunus trituberculatus TaxID=210409 RepID=A0A5B7HNL7_PORTR|nr:hypothetical protein [Portunus trituberculatus]